MSVVAGVVGVAVIVIVIVGAAVAAVAVAVAVDAWLGRAVVGGLALPLRRRISGLGVVVVGLGLRLGRGVCKAVELWDSDGIGRRGHVVGRSRCDGVRCGDAGRGGGQGPSRNEF